MDYRFLTDDDFPVLYRTYLRAFSDYVVDARMSETQFERMLIHHGVRFDLSVGAFEQGEMVGFTANGFDLWEGEPTAYDSGTGVVPEQRGRGVGRGLFDYMLPHLERQGVRQYLLEVITSNQPALSLYRKLGFRETRRLGVWGLDAPLEQSFDPHAEAPALREMPDPDWRLLASFWEGSPCWQNSIESIKRRVTRQIILGAFWADECVGYGIVSPTSGSVFQLAVARDRRRSGIGSGILAGLQARVEALKPLRVNNLDYSLKGAVAFCEAKGFKRLLDQFEMLKDL